MLVHKQSGKKKKEKGLKRKRICESGSGTLEATGSSRLKSCTARSTSVIISCLFYLFYVFTIISWLITRGLDELPTELPLIGSEWRSALGSVVGVPLSVSSLDRKDVVHVATTLPLAAFLYQRVSLFCVLAAAQSACVTLNLILSKTTHCYSNPPRTVQALADKHKPVLPFVLGLS